MTHHRSLFAFSVLSGLMLATRFSHFGDSVSLPDASWVVLFIAGYLGLSWRALAGLLLLAVGIDVWAVGMMQVSDYCLTPAYAVLQLAHISLFALGRVVAGQSFLRAYGLGVGAIFLAYVISNGSFYWLGGRMDELSLSLFNEQFLRYLPAYMGYNTLYLTLSAGGLGLIRWMQRESSSKAALSQ